MATSFLKEYLLSQLCKLGINPCPTKEEEKPVVVKQTLVEAGYCPHIPTDNVPIAFLPAMLRLDKQSWLNALSIEANFPQMWKMGTWCVLDLSITPRISSPTLRS